MAENFVPQSHRAKKGESPSDVSHLLDQRLHVAQIAFERSAACSGQLVFGFWQPAFEVF